MHVLLLWTRSAESWLSDDMTDRPKVHVFLGAPPTSCSPTVDTSARKEGEERCPADTWSHLELTWKDGHLTPLTDKTKNTAVSSGDEGTSRANPERVDGSTAGSQRHNGDGNNASLNPDWATETSCGRQKRAGTVRFEGPDPGGEDHSSSSVLQYLDICFPVAPAEPEHSAHLSTSAQYISTWTLSQSLILRGSRNNIQTAASPQKTLSIQTQPKETSPSASSSTPELFSPATPSPGASAEFFTHPCPNPRVEEGGIVIEATTDGVLCSQEAAQQDPMMVQNSPSQSPEFKRARISEELQTAASTSTTRLLRGPTTLLIRCDKRSERYSVLVAAVHPCHLKEIKLKSGPAAGTSIPLASIVVTDQSGVDMKVVLWRRSAFWALTVNPGDVVLITGLQVNEDRWRGETVLQTTFNSKLLNLGPITTSTSPAAVQQVDPRSLSSLCDFLREQRPLLVCLNPCPPQDLSRLPYATLRSLRVNTLVHALLRVTRTYISKEWRPEAESRNRSAVQLKAVLTVEQPGNQQGMLLLWGAAMDWLPHFKQDRAAVWDFHILLVKDSSDSDILELHSTPWSTVQQVNPASRRAQDFLRAWSTWTGTSSSVELDLDTLLSQKYSGDVELRVQITAFHFLDQPAKNAPQRVVDSSTPLDGIVAMLSSDVTYSGCGRCSAELDTDSNGIYRPCYPCLPHTSVRRYYRDAVLTVSTQGSSQKVCVQVPPIPLQSLLQIHPDALHRSSGPGSKVRLIQVAAEKIQTLLSLPSKTVIITVRSHFLCDENSIIISQDFTLLDLQVPD